MATRKRQTNTTTARKRNVPSFSARSELGRYVDPDELKRGGRVSSVAFLPNPDDDYLSVNSLEVDPPRTIAAYYRKLFKGNIGEVAVACRKVSAYNGAARSAGISISFSRTENKWTYNTGQGSADAYKHRPQTRVPNSYSHCGVEYINAKADELVMRKIARRLSGKRPHLFKSPP